MKKEKYILKDFILIPLILLLFTLIIDSMLNSGIEEYFFLSKLLLTESTILFDEMKIMFISILLVTGIELFIEYKFENNFIVGRMISLILILFIQLFIYNFIILIYNKIIIYLVRIIIIYINQLSNILIRRRLEIKNSDLISVVLIIMLTSFFIVYRYL